MGFLHAPIGDTVETRIDGYVEAGVEPPMPPLTGGEYLMGDLHELGICRPGPEAMPWAEVAAYASLKGLSPDDATTLRAMSAAYVEGFQRGRQPLAKAPWRPPE